VEPLQELAAQAWRGHIISSSLKRNSLLKPLDMILDQLEEEPKPEARATVRAALVEVIFGHLERIAPAGRKPGRTKHEAVKQYVDFFFDQVLDGTHHGDVNRLLARGKLLRSAYLFYIRECIPVKLRETSIREDSEDAAILDEDTSEEAPTTPQEEQ
jgi:hypothetical protein